MAKRARGNDGDRRGGCLLLVGGLVLMTAAVVLAILLGEPTFDSWGPWLATLTGWQRAGVGLLVGTAAAAPLLLLAFSRRIWLVGPLSFYGFTAWTYLTILWFPEGRGGPNDRSISARSYRAEADWYIVTSVVAFHVGIPLMIWTAWRLSCSVDDDEPVPGMVAKRRPKRRGASAG